MPFSDSFWRALADYALKFKTLGSLGTGDPPAAWYAEYLAKGRDAFGSVLINDTSGPDGARVSGIKKFDSEILTDALHCRRWELDNTYELPPHLAQFAAEKIARAQAGRRGFTLRIGP